MPSHDCLDKTCAAMVCCAVPPVRRLPQLAGPSRAMPNHALPRRTCPGAPRHAQPDIAPPRLQSFALLCHAALRRASPRLPRLATPCHAHLPRLACLDLLCALPCFATPHLDCQAVHESPSQAMHREIDTTALPCRDNLVAPTPPSFDRTLTAKTGSALPNQAVPCHALP